MRRSWNIARRVDVGSACVDNKNWNNKHWTLYAKVARTRNQFDRTHCRMPSATVIPIIADAIAAVEETVKANL